MKDIFLKKYKSVDERLEKRKKKTNVVIRFVLTVNRVKIVIT